MHHAHVMHLGKAALRSRDGRCRDREGERVLRNGAKQAGYCVHVWSSSCLEVVVVQETGAAMEREWATRT